MNVLESIILGLVQGLTEFIPVSSSGHLVLSQWLMGRESSHLFLEAINIGTFLALLVYFAPRIIEILRDIFLNKQFTLMRNILLTSIPAGLVGFFLADFIDSAAFFGSVWVVVVTLFVIGAIMVVLEKLPKLSETKNGEGLTSFRATMVGVAQMVALIPGVSRSGSTIIMGRLMGLSAKEAAEYSFLASLPIMAGVTLRMLLQDGEYLAQHASILLWGNVAAFISGLLAVGFLMRYLSRHGLAVFGWYRMALAVVIAAVLLVH